MYDTYWPINPFSEERSQVPILRDVFSDWKLDKGIFDCLETLYDVPWEEDAESSALNYEYFGNHSGGKLVAPVVLNVLGENESLSDADRALLASIIWTKFKEPWTRLWATNVVAYNPIHNYDMSETRILDRDDHGEEYFGEGTTDTTTHGRTINNLHYVFGMNSDGSGKPSDSDSSSEGGTTSNDGSVESGRETEGQRDETETITRAGNIGVTTSQQMIKSERDLWLWNYFDQIYRDIDTVLSLPIYDPCRI